MSDKKQTAVEWFYLQILYADVDINVWKEIRNQAKAIEMEQIKQAYLAGDCQNQTAEQHYNETYIQ